MSGPFLSPSWYRAAALRPRLAPQVTVRLHRYRGRPWYVVADPGSGRVHRLTPGAYSIVDALDGRRTVDSIWQEAATRLGDDAPTQDQVLQLLGQLHANDLLQADAVPDTRELLERFGRAERQRWRSLLNPLSARIRLWNPDRFLAAVTPLLRGVFSRTGIAAWCLAMVVALVLAAENWPALTTDVGDRILATDNLVLLFICLPLLKAVHELGHGVATKRYGGAVPEVGIMFLMLLPMPYVDASAASGFRSRAERVLVGAAGMIVETWVAALALLVWAAVEPGLVRAVAYNVMVAASVTTVLFNANPLMRYDGYYMLADLVEVPNLAQRANRFWTYLVDRYVFAAPDMQPFPATAGERAWFALYAPLSLVYRLTVTFGIALFLSTHYWLVGVGLALWNVVGSVFIPLWKAVSHVLLDAGLRRVRRRAVALTAGGAALAAALLALVPMPHHSVVEGVLWLPETAMVRAGADGFVDRLAAAPGTAMQPGSVVAESADPALAADVEQRRARVAELEAQLKSEEFVKKVDALVTEAELSQARTELANRERRAGRLLARSAAEGVLAVPKPEDLPGRFLKEGDLIGYVLPPGGARLVRVAVDQDDLDLVRSHLTRAELRVPGFPDQVFTTRIIREVPSGREALPSKALGTSGGGSVAVDPRDTKGLRTLRRTFQVDIELPVGAPGEAFGARVLVRLEHDWEPLGEQVYRRMRQLLLSRLQA